MLNSLLRQIKKHPIGISILILGYIVSILIMSISTSNIVQIKQINLLKSREISQNCLNVNANINKSLSFNQYIDIYKDIDKESHIRFCNISAYIDGVKNNIEYSLVCELFDEVSDWKYPFLEGDYYTHDDIVNCSKVVVIGKDLRQYTNNIDGQVYITINGERYFVKGIIGEKDDVSPWDQNIFMPLTSIPDSCKEQLIKSKYLDFLIYNHKKDIKDDFKSVIDNMEALNIESKITYKKINENGTFNSISQNKELSFISILVLLVTLISSINITTYWINKRKKEISIKKALGYTNFSISCTLILEILIINIISSATSLLIQYALNSFNYAILNISLKMTVSNLLNSLIIVFISTIISSSVPLYKSLNMQPIEALKM